MVALGEFGPTEAYTEESKHSIFAWLIFGFATIFTQIIILNMLIAIMGDTFDRVIENQQLAKLKLKVKVLSDFIFYLPKEDKKFIFLATPRNKETDMN